MITPSTQLARLAIRNIHQIKTPAERASVLKLAATHLTDDEERHKINVTVRCIEEAEAAQLELIQEYNSN